jgi:hypothetical protein
MRRTLGQIGVPARAQLISLARNFQSNRALDHKNKTLRRGVAHLAASLELGSVLRELRANRRSRVHDRRALFHSGKSVADKSVGGYQQVIGTLRTSRLAKIMHGTSFS